MIWEKLRSEQPGGMLKGTQDGLWVALSVRQKQPFPGRRTGGIGNLKVSMIDALGIGSVFYFGTLYFCDSPISAVTGLLKLLEKNSRM